MGQAGFVVDLPKTKGYMNRIQRKLCAVCLFLGMAVGSHLQAQYSSQAFRIPATTLQQQSALGQLYEADGTYELDLPGRVYGLSVSGQVELKDSSNSLIRVTVEDIHGREFLVYEVFPLLAEGMSFAIEETGMESAVLEGIEAERLNIRIVNASFRLEAVQHIDEPVPSVQMSKQQTVDSQEDYIVSRLNENLQARNIHRQVWTYGGFEPGDKRSAICEGGAELDNARPCPLYGVHSIGRCFADYKSNNHARKGQDSGGQWREIDSGWGIDRTGRYQGLFGRKS